LLTLFLLMSVSIVLLIEYKQKVTAASGDRGK